MQRAGPAVRERANLPFHGPYEDEEALDSNDEKDKGHEYDHTRSWGRPGERSWPAIIIMSTYRAIRYRRPPRLIQQRPYGFFRRIFLFCLAVYWIRWAWNGYSASSWEVLPQESTMVYHEEDVRRVWEWEILSGHWSSWRPVQNWKQPPRNPSLPSAQSMDEIKRHAGVEGCGWPRNYPNIDDLINAARQNQSSAYFPPRPLPGSMIDIDLVNQYCDHTSGQTLRNCLEYLRIGAGLDDTLSRQPLFRAGLPPPEAQFFVSSGLVKKKPLPIPYDWRYMYLEDRTAFQAPMSEWTRYAGGKGLEKPLSLASPKPPIGAYEPYTIGSGTRMAQIYKEFKEGIHTLDWTPGQCDDDYPRIFHMYVDGDFGDRGYMTLLSFLYTQNLGLHLDPTKKLPSTPCRPMFWVWINRATLKGKSLHQYIILNPWSAPFTEPPFSDVVRFQFWNIRDQVDNTPEWMYDWRSIKARDLTRQGKKRAAEGGGIPSEYVAEELLFNTFKATGEDIARWLLPHRYGGIYISPGVLFLRDWEDIWNYRAAFATRASDSSIAVLKLNRQSALGTFILRTALRHGFDLEPRSIQRYATDARVNELLFSFPDMVADAAYYSSVQTKKPVVPVMDTTDAFFEPTGSESSATALGISRFYRGAWFHYPPILGEVPFDKYRNYPDLDMPRNDQSRAYRSPDSWDLPWSAVFKRTLEAYYRGESPNMYGEMIWKQSH